MTEHDCDTCNDCDNGIEEHCGMCFDEGAEGEHAAEELGEGD